MLLARETQGLLRNGLLRGCLRPCQLPGPVGILALAVLTVVLLCRRRACRYPKQNVLAGAKLKDKVGPFIAALLPKITDMATLN